MTLEENKETVRRYFEEFHNRRDMAIAPDIAPEQVVPTIQGIAAVLRTAFPDYQITIEAMVAEADMVASVWRGRGTHQGPWESPIGSIPATGNQVEWTATTTLRLEDGKIVETIGTNWDHLGILQQMGVVTATVPRSGA